MGLASWLAAALVASLLARLVGFQRLRFFIELAGAILFASLAGLGATALDFGGWSVLDWRAALFALLASLAAIALVRLVTVYRS